MENERRRTGSVFYRQPLTTAQYDGGVEQTAEFCYMRSGGMNNDRKQYNA
jgi:hypothetical protein